MSLRYPLSASNQELLPPPAFCPRSLKRTRMTEGYKSLRGKSPPSSANSLRGTKALALGSQSERSARGGVWGASSGLRSMRSGVRSMVRSRIWDCMVCSLSKTKVLETFQQGACRASIKLQIFRFGHHEKYYPQQSNTTTIAPRIYTDALAHQKGLISYQSWRYNQNRVQYCACLYNSLTIQRSMDPRAITKLNEELSYFKSTNNFTLHFRPRELLDLYECVTERSESRRLAARIDKEMHAACGKSVYVALKWLGFHHKLLQETHLSAAIQRSAESLAKLPAVADKRHYEKYIWAKLLSPYKQYLLKLAQMQLNVWLHRDSPRQGEVQSLFCMYNLVVFAMQQLSGAVRQFSSYFLRFHPCLNEYTAKVGKDLHGLMRRLRRGYQSGELPKLTFLQLEQLEGGLALFDIHAQRLTNNWIFPQTNAQSLQFQAGEEERTEGSILQPIQGSILQPIQTANHC